MSNSDATLNRNMNGDFMLMVPGKDNEIVAKCFSPLWFAILNFAEKASAQVPPVPVLHEIPADCPAFQRKPPRQVSL